MQLKSSFSGSKYSGPKITHDLNLSLTTVDWSRNAQTIVLTVVDQVTYNPLFSIGSRLLGPISLKCEFKGQIASKFE